jgi:hypothetical protein
MYAFVRNMQDQKRSAERARVMHGPPRDADISDVAERFSNTRLRARVPSRQHVATPRCALVQQQLVVEAKPPLCLVPS